MKRVIVGFIAAAFLLTSASAFAQQPGGAPAPGGGGGSAKATGGGGKEDGYGYEFSDDPLAAGGFGPNDATIRVRPGPVRTTLIRPRTSFVPEMLKSVENL
ncbi:MAG: hypothetical protein JST00_39195 [Deltaproteobacteria bacterium]|nr:hypothetical protein [Deltaproteobacteria bacterium]